MNSEKNVQDFVNNLIKKKEGTTLDFKLKITSKGKIAKTIAALANTEGGYLVIGISDQKKILGIDPEEERFMIESANSEHCVPPAKIEIQEAKMFNEDFPFKSKEEELSLLLVHILPAKDEPISVKSMSGSLKMYRREGDKTLAV